MSVFQTNKTFKDYVFLFFLTLVIYWPLSINFLSLKNDALVLLSFRYHISESIRHGYLPFWSPYLFTGFPIHADMQSAVWNPFVYILSLISKYDVTTLEWEMLIYLFLSAIGMYRLIKYLGLSRITALCCAVAFMSCGYMTDSISVIPWIPGAAFIPFVLLYFLRLLRSLLLSDAFKLSICLSLLFLCGYPSFFIYINYIIGISFLLWLIYQLRNKNKTAVWKALFHLAVAYASFLLICSPAIISYLKFLPYYSRGSGLSIQKAAENPFVPFSFISYILPNVASKARFLSTDPSMRNAYIGLFIFLFFLISLRKTDRFKAIILLFTVVSLLFSLGDLTPVQTLSYHFLPLMNTFRHPGTIRVFTTIGMILLAAFPLDAFFKEGRNEKLKWLSYFTLALLLSSGIYFITTDPPQNSQARLGFDPSVLKQFLHDLSFQKFALIICLLQSIFLLAFLLMQRKGFLRRAIFVLFILNSVAFAWTSLPFTVVSQYKTSEADSYIHSFPDGFPPPDVTAPVEAEVYSDSIQLSPHGYQNFYNKKITIQDHIVIPSLNSDYDLFLRNKLLRSRLKGHPFVYVSDDSVSIEPSLIKVLKWTPNRFVFQINSNRAGNLQLFQQYNPNWHVSVNGKPDQIQKSNIAFMSVNIPAGTSLIEWKYEPQKVLIAMVVSALSLLSVFFYFVFKRKQKNAYE